CSRHLMLKRTDHGLASRTRMGLARHSTTAHRRGYDLSALRARKFGPGDCREFDYVLVMDRGNYNRAVDSCGGASGNVRLLMEFAPRKREREVPDPYAGGAEGFERVLDLIEEAC